MIESLFRWVPGHNERVARRDRMNIKGLHKALDIVSFGKLAKGEEEAYKEGQRWARQNVVLPLHNFLYDLTHRDQE